MTATTTRALRLPRPGGALEPYVPGEPASYGACPDPVASRVAFAAAHVVADPRAYEPGGPAAVDWEATLAFRHHLWAHGLGVAEAMDTAQRGAGLDWASARELIKRTAADARAGGGRLACGAGTDHRDAAALHRPPTSARRTRSSARSSRARARRRS